MLRKGGREAGAGIGAKSSIGEGASWSVRVMGTCGSLGVIYLFIIFFFWAGMVYPCIVRSSSVLKWDNYCTYNIAYLG